MEKALRNMAEKSSNAFAVYTCPPIIFAIVHTKGDGFHRFMVIDTHKVSDEVGGNGNGEITCADYCEQQLPNVTKELARWIRKRIATSVRRPVPQSLLHVDLQRGDVQLEGNDNEDGLLTALDDFEKTQETKGGSKIDIDHTQTARKTIYKSPSSVLQPSNTEVIVWKGHLTKFGLTAFPEFQITAINTFEKGNDVVVIQRTGSGKSLVYQVRALFCSTQYTIVICPTISLILNQVNQLNEKGVDAIPFGNRSGNENHNVIARLDNIEAEKPSLVYMTLECFDTHMDLFAEHKDEIKMVVLDEAHKIFDRNLGFRNCYESLKEIHAKFPETPESGNEHSSQPWKDVAQEVYSLVGQNYAIVYVDFKNDVEKMVASLVWNLGVWNRRRKRIPWKRHVSDIISRD